MSEAPARATAALSCLPPVLATTTRLVILGSFPGAASLAAGQYYAHPRNHFWRILSEVWQVELVLCGYDARLEELARRRVGLWDVYAACEREGSLDSAIRHAVPNNLSLLTSRAPALAVVAHNGGESARSRRLTRALGVEVCRVPSSSPANASWSLARKVAAWREVFARAGVVSPRLSAASRTAAPRP